MSNKNPRKLLKNIFSWFIHKIKKILIYQINAYFVIYKLEQDLGPVSSLKDKISYINRYNNIVYSRKIAKFLYKIFIYSTEQLYDLEHIANNDKQIYILHVCVWGPAYINKMSKFLVPSLLALGNIPSLSKKFNIHFLVHCDHKTKDKLQSNLSMNLLANFVIIKYIVVPEAIFKFMHIAQSDFLLKILCRISNIFPNWKYFLLGCLQNIAMIFAQKNNAFISFLMPDLIFSNRALTRSFIKIQKEGKKAVVATAFRTLDIKVEQEVNKYYIDNKLNISAEILSQIAITCMHKEAKYRIVSHKNYNFQLTAQLIFHYPSKKEIVIRALHYHPLLVDFNKINHKVLFNYHPIDAQFLCDIIDTNNSISKQIWVIEDPNYIGIMEVSKTNLIPSLWIKRRNKDIRTVISNYLLLPQWNLLNKFLINKRCIYKYKGNLNYIFSEISDADIINLK